MKRRSGMVAPSGQAKARPTTKAPAEPATTFRPTLDDSLGNIRVGKVTDINRPVQQATRLRPQTTEIPFEPVFMPEVAARAKALAEGYGACLPPAGDDKILCYRTDCVDDRRTGQWKLLEFDVCFSASDRRPDGVAVCSDERFIRKVKHWADLQAADAWAQDAWRLVNQEARVRALDNMSGLPEPRGPAFGESGEAYKQRIAPLLARYEAQADYVREIFQAIANFYNALNIPWAMDPEARALYRKWLAGPPDARSEFAKNEDYNGGNWYAKSDITPNSSNYPLITRAASAEQGLLTEKARKLHKAFDPGVNRTHFRQRAGVRLEGPGSDWRDPMKDPYLLGQNPKNVGFATPLGLGTVRIPKSGRPIGASQYDETPAQWQEGVRIMRDPQKVTLEEPQQDSQFAADWRSFSWTGYITTNNTQQAGTPLRDYLEWAREWAASILNRGAARVLRDSREYVLKTNKKWVDQFGGGEAFINSIAGRDEDLKRELRGTGGAIANAIIGSTANTIGSVLGGLTGGVANVILGSVTQISNIVTSLINTGEIRSFGRDDLGRWKPSLERATLGGDVNDTESPPSAEGPAVPVWFCRNPMVDPQAEMDRRTPMVEGPVQRDIFDRPPPAPPGLSPTTKAVIAVGAVAALGIAGVAVYKKYYQPASTRRTMR